MKSIILIAGVLSFSIMPVMAKGIDGSIATFNQVTCFKKSEEISGMNKICYYDCLGSGAAITIKSHELCPLTIKRWF